MEPENSGRAGLALPNPQGPSSAPEIELSEVPLRENPLLEKAGSSPPCHTWLMFLKRELEFLGVTQILIALVCLCFGIIVCSVINISEFKEDIFSSFKAGYPFWGAVFFAISGFLPIMSEKKHATYLEIVAMILFLTILGFCSAVSLTIYGVGELVQGNKIVEDRLYEELNIYSPIYSELEDKAEESSPVDS